MLRCFFCILGALSVLSLLPLNPRIAWACSGSPFGSLEGQVGLSPDVPSDLIGTPHGLVIKLSAYEYGIEGRDRLATFDDVMRAEVEIVVRLDPFLSEGEPAPAIEGSVEPIEGVSKGYLLWRPVTPLVVGERYRMFVGERQNVQFTITEPTALSAPRLERVLLSEVENGPKSECCSYDCELFLDTCGERLECSSLCWNARYEYSLQYELMWDALRAPQSAHTALYELIIDGDVQQQTQPWSAPQDLQSGMLSITEQPTRCFQISALSLLTGERLTSEELCPELTSEERLERRVLTAADFNEEELDGWRLCEELTTFQQEILRASGRGAEANRSDTTQGDTTQGDTGDEGCAQRATSTHIPLPLWLIALLFMWSITHPRTLKVELD